MRHGGSKRSPTEAPELAFRTGQTWKPSHQLARRCDLDLGEGVALDEQQVRAYFAGETIQCDLTGWQIVRHHGRGLGWIKASRGNGKNQLPAAARQEIQ